LQTTFIQFHFGTNKLCDSQNLSHPLNLVILLTVYVDADALFKTIKYSDMMINSFSICLLGGVFIMLVAEINDLVKAQDDNK